MVMPNSANIVKKQRLVVAGNHKIYYEDIMAAGEMTELDTSAGPIDTSDQIVLFEAFQKVFVVNGTNLKVADFINTEIELSSALTSGEVCGHGDILTQGTSPNQAFMVVDHVNADRDKIRGYAYYTGTTEAFVTTVDISSNDALADMDPNPILNASITAINTGPLWYDWTVYPNTIKNSVTRTYGTMPDSAYLGCLYMGSCVLAGDSKYPHQFYMSRVAFPWDFLYTRNDALSAVAGNNTDAGEIGGIIKSLTPYKDDYLIIGCSSSAWFFNGHPAAGGSINELSLTTGIFGPDSWCWDGQEYFYFWGHNGIYKTTVPGVPVCISQVSLPNLIKVEAADPGTHRITMEFDRSRNGILISITLNADGTHSSYWLSLLTDGLFPETYPTQCGIFSMVYYNANATSLSGLLVGCTDGYIRVFDEAAKSDNIGPTDEAINSYVALGPMPLAEDPENFGKISNINVTTAGGAAGDSDDIELKLFSGYTPEKIIENLVANTGSSLTVTVKGPATRFGRGQAIKQRTRGAYAAIRLANSIAAKTWAFEQVSGTIKPSGKMR